MVDYGPRDWRATSPARQRASTQSFLESDILKVPAALILQQAAARSPAAGFSLVPSPDGGTASRRDKNFSAG